MDAETVIEDVLNEYIEPALILIQGLPGSGKSTFGKRLAKEIGAYMFEADDYFMKDGEYVFDPSKLHEAHKKCLQNTKRHIEAGDNVIVSNTFTTRRELLPYLNLRADKFLIKMETNYGSIHNVPDFAIERMKERLDNCEVEPDYIIDC